MMEYKKGSAEWYRWEEWIFEMGKKVAARLNKGGEFKILQFCNLVPG